MTVDQKIIAFECIQMRPSPELAQQIADHFTQNRLHFDDPETQSRLVGIVILAAERLETSSDQT
jgi:hypothetical protein